MYIHMQSNTEHSIEYETGLVYINTYIHTTHIYVFQNTNVNGF